MSIESLNFISYFQKLCFHTFFRAFIPNVCFFYVSQQILTKFGFSNSILQGKSTYEKLCKILLLWEMSKEQLHKFTYIREMLMKNYGFLNIFNQWWLICLNQPNLNKIFSSIEVCFLRSVPKKNIKILIALNSLFID